MKNMGLFLLLTTALISCNKYECGCYEPFEKTRKERVVVRLPGQFPVTEAYYEGEWRNDCGQEIVKEISFSDYANWHRAEDICE